MVRGYGVVLGRVHNRHVMNVTVPVDSRVGVFVRGSSPRITVTTGPLHPCVKRHRVSGRRRISGFRPALACYKARRGGDPPEAERGRFSTSWGKLPSVGGMCRGGNNVSHRGKHLPVENSKKRKTIPSNLRVTLVHCREASITILLSRLSTTPSATEALSRKVHNGRCNTCSTSYAHQREGTLPPSL